MKVFIKSLLILTLVTFYIAPTIASAQTTINASALLPRVSVSISPSTGTFVEGSTFEVPIILNTRESVVNGIDIKIGFDPKKMSVIKPSSGQSIVGVWVEPPSFDNARGTANYVGVIPNGIKTNSGIIGTITFKAISTGSAIVSVKSDSSVLLNDGIGSEATLDLGRANYTLVQKAPEGVIVFSETHPFSSAWYNNNNPVLSWEKEENVTGFSYELDNKPLTIPDNNIDTTETIKSFENLQDGLWYFHVKAIKGESWGTTGHFLVRIDTTPPASFKPEANYLVAATILVERTLVSFFTTDNLSGIDHYEVGVIDKSQPVTESPVFVQTESPFQVPLTKGSELKVIVRAVDKAGNVRDESIDVRAPLIITQFIKDYLVYILAGIILLGFVMLIIHYIAGRHIIRHLRRAFALVKKEEAEEILQQNQNSKSLPDWSDEIRNKM